MGNKSSRAPAPILPKCAAEQIAFQSAQRELERNTTTYQNSVQQFQQRREAANQCSPQTAAARPDIVEPSPCIANQTKLNMARRDIQGLEQEWAKCYPAENLQKQLSDAQSAIDAWIATQRAALSEASQDYDTKYASIEKIAQSARVLYKALYDKEVELARLTGARENTEQLERRERRAFLDASPQSGVGGAPGIRTADDRALFTFWITYGAAIILCTIVLLRLFGARIGATSLQSQGSITLIVALAAYAFAYYFISFYG